MSHQKLISFDLEADFGFFKKPDYNDGALLSYNMLHKPALLGILGAVIGLPGYCGAGVLPEYYRRLDRIPVGIAPLAGKHDKGNFRKTVVKYANTVGYANQDGNLLIEENMLIRPAYRCYLLLSLDDPDQTKLYHYLRKGEAEFIPYLGKNEFQAWIGETFIEYEFHPFMPEAGFRIDTLFIKEGVVKDKKVTATFSISLLGMINESSFSYFERLPVGFDTDLMQYRMAEFVYTDWILKADARIPDLYLAKEREKEHVIQLF